MRIAFVVSEFPCLSETFILNQITGLIERGHEVDIFADVPRNDSTVHGDVLRYNLLARTSYFHKGDGNLTIPGRFARRLVKGMRLAAVKDPLCLLKSLNVLKYGKQAASLGLFYKAATFLNKDRYDIIHCHFGPKGVLGAMLKDILAVDGKVVTTFHGADMSKFSNKKRNDLYRHLFHKGDLFMPVSERWKKELIHLGCEKQKIIVHRMGIDVDKFTFTPRMPKEEGRINILTVARFVEKKGIKYGLHAIAKVLGKYPALDYKIIGDGPLRGETENLIDSLGVGKNVTILGWRPQEEVVELMRSADIFLAPSTTAHDGDQEGIPVVLMEALAQGMPVLSTRHSGIPELVQNGKSGFLVAERDVDAIAERLTFLIEHPEIWPEMGKAGRSYVEKSYNINTLNDRLVGIYEQLLNNGIPQNIRPVPESL